jgi:hypothetical protein
MLGVEKVQSLLNLRPSDIHDFDKRYSVTYPYTISNMLYGDDCVMLIIDAELWGGLHVTLLLLLLLLLA